MSSRVAVIFLDLFSYPGLLLLFLTLLTFLTNIFKLGSFHCPDHFVCLLNWITPLLFRPMRIDYFYSLIYAKSVYNKFNLCHVWNSDFASEKIHFFQNNVIHPSFLTEAGRIMSWVFEIAGVFSYTLTHMFFGFTHGCTRLWAITGLFPYLQVFFLSVSRSSKCNISFLMSLMLLNNESCLQRWKENLNLCFSSKFNFSFLNFCF